MESENTQKPKKGLKKPLVTSQQFKSDEENEYNTSVLQENINTMQDSSLHKQPTSVDINLANLDSDSNNSASEISDTSDEDETYVPQKVQGFKSLKSLNKLKITPDDIKILSQQYRSDGYDFRTEGSAFVKRMRDKGIV